MQREFDKTKEELEKKKKKKKLEKLEKIKGENIKRQKEQALKELEEKKMQEYKKEHEERTNREKEHEERANKEKEVKKRKKENKNEDFNAKRLKEIEAKRKRVEEKGSSREYSLWQTLDDLYKKFRRGAGLSGFQAIYDDKTHNVFRSEYPDSIMYAANKTYLNRNQTVINLQDNGQEVCIILAAVSNVTKNFLTLRKPGSFIQLYIIG